ncbi:serine/threonine-protein kinase [Dolichospermum sp. LEGE 00246]|uniref:serine/threonine protein kinase n=1 Tax=Dolichospermum sp. LEGE 00246 TaxID=1828605 RepID=UPI0018822B9C|nr:serine/threonine-protein kinase [Dolichospermum sp. LEGE 00246]MBE9258468.1 protein kinase [Dolichospermum sp. LEGE 00246]
MNFPPSSNYWHGRSIGDNQRYRIDRPLAVGGMGEVLLATDTRLGQQVVLKLLKDTLVTSQEMRKRFEREVAVCAALQSDHIVKISDCGMTPEGYPFYVMEYLRGQTLRQLLLREQRLSVEQTVSIISQVCQGLQMAHQGVTLQKDGSNEHIQVIHRDLKPDNIFLVPTDLGEWVKILDFGVAKIRSESSEQTSLTNTFIGTFRYAAPEQIQNKKNLDARADIYSLGIILYEMLSAADPFGFSVKGNNISEASWVLAHAYEPPTPLREQPGCEHLSTDIEAVVLKCLHKNPNNRFASVAELNQALQAASDPVANTGTKQEQYFVSPEPILDQPTISKPLSSVESNQPLYNQGLNNETVPRPLQPIQLESLKETILPPCPIPSPAANNETVPRPLQQIEPEQPEGIIFQHRPTPYLAANNEILPQPVQSIQPKPPEGTIVQPRPTPSPAANNENLPQPVQSIQPKPPEGTIVQSRPTPSPAANNEILPQPVSQINNNTPDNTIFQPKSKHLENSKNSHIFQKNLLIGLATVLAIVLAFFAGMFIFSLQSNQGSKDSTNVPNSTQKN